MVVMLWQPLARRMLEMIILAASVILLAATTN
jgi:hypothetical protein